MTYTALVLLRHFSRNVSFRKILSERTISWSHIWWYYNYILKSCCIQIELTIIFLKQVLVQLSRKKILLEQMTSGVVIAHPRSPTEIQSPVAERWDGPKTEHKCHLHKHSNLDQSLLHFLGDLAELTVLATYQSDSN